MKRFFSFFYTDLHWKLLSLGLAFLLWLLAINMNDPTQNESFNVMLRPINLEILSNAGLELVNPDALDIPVRVGIRAPRRELEYLNSTEGIRAQAERITPVVDFRVVNIDDVLNSEGSVTVRLDISVNLYEGYEHFSINPSFIYVEMDAIVHQTFPVIFDIVGEVDSGLELQPIRLANSNVTVTGSRTDIARIDSVRVYVDVWGVLSDEEQENLQLVVYDHNGYIITDLVHLSVSETTATVSVWPVESVEIIVESTGYVASGFAVEDIDFAPKTVEVISTPARLQNLDYILIEVDLSGRSYSFVDNVDVREWLTDGIFLRSGENHNIAVTVDIEPVERRTFNIPMDNVRSRGISVAYDVLSEMASIRIDVYGPRALLAELTNADIGLEIDLRNLPIGIHFVTLSVDLPEDITLAQSAPALQVQIREPAAEDIEEPTSGEVPEPPTLPNIPDYNTNNTGDYEPELEPDDYPYYPYYEDDNSEVPDSNTEPTLTPDDEEIDD